MTKQITVKDLEEQVVKDLEEQVKDLEARERAERELRAQRTKELEDAKREIDRLKAQLLEEKDQRIVLSRIAGQLEGYKQRVEHVDDLKYGRPPQRSVANACAPSPDEGRYRR